MQRIQTYRINIVCGYIENINLKRRIWYETITYFSCQKEEKNPIEIILVHVNNMCVCVLLMEGKICAAMLIIFKDKILIKPLFHPPITQTQFSKKLWLSVLRRLSNGLSQNLSFLEKEDFVNAELLGALYYHVSHPWLSVNISPYPAHAKLGI